MRCSAFLVALGALTWASTARAEDPASGIDEGFGIDEVETQVYGGAENEECQWPTTVAVTGGNSLCTGALVHPRLVTYAAHCGGGNKTIRFGETSTTTTLTRQGTCMTNPEYLGVSNQSVDWAFCVLDEPVDLPISPPLYGCETEMIQANQPVVVVGYGDSNTGSAGTKRWGDTIIVSTFGNTVNIGAQGTGVTTCEGDSGGTAYIEMDDGSYRAISMVSTGLIGCDETTGVHALMHPAVPWIEENAQIDITPCHDADGTWHPNPNCTGFFAGGSTPSGQWSNGCEGTPASGPAETCGSSFEATPDGDPPAVTITSPVQGDEFDTGARVSIDIDALDDGYGVEAVWIEIEGMEQPVRDEYSPYGFADVPFPDGVYTVIAHAVDWAGNEGISEPVTIGVNASVPGGSAGSDSDSGGSSGDTASGGSDSTSDGSDGGDSEASGGSGSDTESAGGTGDGGGGEGCGCRADATDAPRGWLLLLGMPLVATRRRRRR